MTTTSLKQDYRERIVPALMKEFSYTTVMQVPKLEKIVLNQGLGIATADKKIIDTAIAEKGSNLSGGQCQRLALARALLHDSPVYIFDEATSNIDAESEDMIMSVIKTLAKKKTVIFISHKLSNVIDAACIYMIDDGKVIEEGTHAQLIKRKGKYAVMYNEQYKLEAYARGEK